MTFPRFIQYQQHCNDYKSSLIRVDTQNEPWTKPIFTYYTRYMFHFVLRRLVLLTRLVSNGSLAATTVKVRLDQVSKYWYCRIAIERT